LHRAAAAADYAIREIARVHPSWMEVMPAGDLRRGCELVGDLSFVALDPHLHGNDRTITQGDLTIHVASPKAFGAALLFATGSDQHIEALRKLAKTKGMTLDADGLSRSGRLVARSSEEAIYDALDLSFI